LAGERHQLDVKVNLQMYITNLSFYVV